MLPRHLSCLTALFTGGLAAAVSFAALAFIDRALPMPPIASALLLPGPNGVNVTRPALAEPPAVTPTTAERLLAEPPPLPSPSASPWATATALPTLAPELFLPPAAELPATAQVGGIAGHGQSRPLSCEARSAADWAAFFGVAIGELEFLSQLPSSDDPDRGFVGDVYGAWGQVPPAAYGVHAGPVARLLQAYGLNADARRYTKWETVQAELAAGRPVIAWVVGHVEPGTSEIYTAGDGRATVVARFEHTVIVVGYSSDTVTVVDGARRYERPLERFLESWGALRNMVVVLDT